MMFLENQILILIEYQFLLHFCILKNVLQSVKYISLRCVQELLVLFCCA